MAKKTKIIIVEWSHDLIDPNILIAYTADGGRLQLKRVKDEDLPPNRACHCPLYCYVWRDYNPAFIYLVFALICLIAAYFVGTQIPDCYVP